MKYFFTQLIIGILSVILLLYFFQQEYFLPIKDNIIDWYNIVTVLFLTFILSQSVISLIFFTTEKFLTCGIREFPDSRRAIKWGIGIAFCIVISLILSLLNILPIYYALALLVIIIIILNILKIF